MRNTLKKEIKENNIYIDTLSLPKCQSCSVKVSNCYFIGIDKDITPPERKTALYHELGHCFTNSFYNIGEPLNNRKIYEYRADKWSIENFCPYGRYIEILKQGYNTNFKISEYLEITVDFANKIIEYYDSRLKQSKEYRELMSREIA